MKWRAGDWVEVKSKEEILATLDKKGRLDEMPFMPQMFSYCGQRFKVYKSAHKTCDTVNPVRSLRVTDAVHLELRCDGEVYGGCQAGCLIFWKSAWLKLVEGNPPYASQNRDMPGQRHIDDSSEYCTDEDVRKGTRENAADAGAETRYVCQATQLPHIGHYLPWWDVRQYVDDYASGNVTSGQMLRGALYASYSSLVQAGIGLGPILRWVYDKFQSVWGGVPYPRKSGTIPFGQSTPTSVLDLQPGDLVRVKSHEEILATLDTNCKNRGLTFDGEMVPYCGETFKVRTRLQKFIDEKTGKLVVTKNPGIILDNVWCRSRYSWCRMFCPRSIFPWWREIWLERIAEKSESRTKVSM